MEKLESLWDGLGNHLSLYALLQGCVPGEVLLDHPENPKAALACVYGRRFFLAGLPGNAAFNATLATFFREVVFPDARGRTAEAFLLYYGTGGWQAALQNILPEAELIPVEWQYYACTELRNNRREALPTGFELHYIDPALLARSDLKNLDALTDEMCSERASVEDFLQHSFGVCVLHEAEIAGMCLSEYNCLDRCEVGIMTLEAYQRRGLATLMASVLVEHALQNGITQIGWHCYARNRASAATALKAGFIKREDYPACIVRIPSA